MDAFTFIREMKDEFSIAVAAIGGLVLILSLISKWLARSYLSGPMVGLAVGILLGPEVFKALDPAQWGLTQSVLVEQVARLSLGIGLVAVALRIPSSFPRANWRTFAILLGLIMPLMCLTSGLLVFFILGIPFGIAMVIGAIVTPTDPIIASSIVTGPVAEKFLPEKIRNTLSFESGSNDGLAYLLVFLPALFLTKSTGEAWQHFLVKTLLWEVGGAILFGFAAGWALGKLLDVARARGLIAGTSLLAYTVALSLAVLGIGRLLKTDAILAVFVAGMAFDSTVDLREQKRGESIQEAVNQFFGLPIFILLGTILPWQEWMQLGWAGLALAVSVLLFRRFPFFLLLRKAMPVLTERKDALFLGWFGPVGISALFYAALIEHKHGFEHVWAVTTLCICCSIIVHGVTAAPFSRSYGRVG